jgi:hypothetical protein
MFRASRGYCVLGVVLLVLVGCAGTDQFNLQFLQTGLMSGDRVVAASLESVSDSTQANLARLGMKVVATPQGQDLRLKATTPSGDQFALVLTRVQTDQGERTRVRFEGTNSSHEKILLQIFAQAENAGKGKTPTAQK